MRLFLDRRDAGRRLAAALAHLRGRDALVLALPRGGVPVGHEVAAALGAPLDVVVARKLGVPGVEEVALGAIAEGSDRAVDDAVGWYIGVPPRVVARVAARERAELERRVRLYRGGRPLPDLRGRTVVLVDDGLATGATLRAAAHALRSRRPARLVAAVPVACAPGVAELRADVDDVAAVATPEPFGTVSAWYEAFPPVGDAEVLRLLGRGGDAALTPSPPAGRGPDAGAERAVTIDVGGAVLEADVGVPDAGARALVILAHGGGSSRHSYRNRYIAGRLRLTGLATLRLDLLTAEERAADAGSAALRFDVARIAARLAGACDWAAREAGGFPGAGRVAIVGARMGAAAALVAAAERPALVRAVVARGGRVDLAGDALTRVRAPALLVVGGADHDTLRRNREALRSLPASARLVVVPGAGHTFEEPGALGAVGEHVVRWLDRHCGARRAGPWLRALRRVGIA
jgi:putative phosphoribosyl transferase